MSTTKLFVPRYRGYARARAISAIASGLTARRVDPCGKVNWLRFQVVTHFDFYGHYNFCRIHKTLSVTPAMEAGISYHVWSIEEIVDLLYRSRTIAA
jgi:hypothetical protein